LAVSAGKFVVHEVEDMDAKWRLGRALHTLQDSFSPAHTKRDVGTLVIEDVYAWDPENKDPHGDWPGHSAYDEPGHDKLTRYLEYKAYEASRDLIVAVLGNLHRDAGTMSSELRSVMWANLKKGW
jgi:hypothetical protein